MTLNDLVEMFPDETFLVADGFDECIIGVEENTMRLVYSYQKCLEKLIDDGMSFEDAIEFYEFNVKGAYIGEKTPIFCTDEII